MLSTPPYRREMNFLDYTHGIADALPATLKFSPQGEQRLHHIHGWLLGLQHAGETQRAQQYAEYFLDAIERLAQANVIDEPLQVPARKVFLDKDSCLHSFAFAAFTPIPPEVWGETLEKHEDRQQHAWEELKIHHTDMLEFHQGDPVHYGLLYNGGLIYHGPGAGQTFAVRLGDSPNLWSVHT